MGDIKSARELALEKAEGIEKATQEERLQWKYIPEGEKLAARFLKQEGDPAAELAKFPPEVAKYVAGGASAILIRNINLPATEAARKTNKLVMDALKAIKQDKTGVENVYSRIRRIFTHFAEQGEQQRKQAYASLKANFEAKLKQAIQQQYGNATGMKIDAESQPQFKEEWRKIQSQLDSQYLQLLDEYKQELSSLK